MMQLNTLHLVILLGAVLLTGCGSGGGDDDDSATTGSSDWDEMVWDQDNWS